ncbi:eukaryotic translation initiation [Trichuris trichiura]|uniref:Eukaryotic translation initiation n=1 Tax=Trichuris trichiura TaxID=36087 RepID=A0A077ZDS2_TRITR|nr:eukaryotic translation initiation [Trichuris trichiura]
MDDQNWENETYVPGMLSMRSAWQGDEGDDNVKENWFEDEDEEEPQKAPVTPSQPKNDSERSKLKASAANEKAEKERQLTQKELEEIQKKSDLAIARETFSSLNMGAETSDALNSLSGDFDLMRRIIVEKVTDTQNNEGYAEFIDRLFHDLCASMSSEVVRKIARNLNSLSNEISKIEKEKHKPKPKKKNTIAKLSRGGDFIDELKAGMEDAYDYYDDEDFM